MNIYICDNNQCRLRGKHLKFKGNDSGTCLSCRHKLNRYEANDFGHGVEVVAALSRKPEPPAVKCGDGMEYDQRGEVLGRSIVDFVKDADPLHVDVDDGMVEWMEARDSINESFINLVEYALEHKALYIETSLRELNRELLDVVSNAINGEDS